MAVRSSSAKPGEQIASLRICRWLSVILPVVIVRAYNSEMANARFWEVMAKETSGNSPSLPSDAITGCDAFTDRYVISQPQNCEV